MCWRSSKAVRQIAVEDIKTFKVGIKYIDDSLYIDDSFISYYYHHEYFPSQKYETYMCATSTSDEVIVDSGFHSYNSKFCKARFGARYKHRLEVISNKTHTLLGYAI